MASLASNTVPQPSNFYLRNPLALLVDKTHLIDSNEADLTRSRLKVANGSTERRTAEAKNGGENTEPIVAPFIPEDSITKAYILELANLVEASQHKDTQSDSQAQEEDPKSKRNLTGDLSSQKRTPYQLLYSKTFQCYTSLAFYGAMLTQLRKWVKQLDSAPAKFRGVVWAHLTCMIGSDHQSTDPLGVVLHSILSRPKMDLMDVELLHLSILLSAKLVPQLLAASSGNQAPSTGPVTAKENGQDKEHKSTAEAHGEGVVGVSPVLSGNEGQKERKKAGMAALESTDSSAVLGTKADEVGGPSHSSATPTSGISSSPASLPSPSTSSSSHPDTFTPPSAEVVSANAIAFSHYYRLRVFQLHSDLFLQIETQRRLLAALTSPLIGTTGPSQRELSVALSARHLAYLQLWLPKLDALSSSSRDAVLSAVQNVPSIRTSLAAAKSISHIVQKWEVSPIENSSSISALFNALRMLQDFGVLLTKDFPNPDYSLQNALQLPTMGAPTPISSQATPAASSASGDKPTLVQPPALSTPLGWGSSSLPWSPVPSPLTTFSGPFGSASPLTFVGPRASPLTSLHSAGLPGSPLRSVDPTFVSSAPQGVLLPNYTRPTPSSNGLPGLKTGSDIADRPSASGSFSFLSGRSAFGALKRAAEEEAENDMPAKRPKFAEY